MGFQVFEKNSAPIPTVPAVTIQKRGLISLNRAAFAMIENPAAVELLWDPDRRVIGLRATPVENPNAYPVRSQSPGSQRGPVLIAGSLFTRYIGLDTSEARRWVPTLEGEILCLDLNTTPAKVTSNRLRSAATTADTPEETP